MRNLISDLNKAEKILSEYSGGYSGEHLSAEEFHSDLVDRIKNWKMAMKVSLRTYGFGLHQLANGMTLLEI